MLWTNPEGALVCLMTNDAEGDKQEIVSENYESLLPEFIKKAAVQGMRLFTMQVRPSTAKHPLIAIEHGILIDVVKKTALPDMTILLENGKIIKIGNPMYTVSVNHGWTKVYSHVQLRAT